MSGSEELSLGFLGLGWIGTNRMSAVLGQPGVRVAALAEPDAAALGAAHQLAPNAVCVSTLDELLAQPLDAIVIATPSALHAEQTLAVLDRGIPVFCQKPLGRSGAEVERVVERARARDCALGVDLSYRDTAALSELYTLVRSGALGRIFAANLVFHNAYGPDKAWFYDPKQSGGGALMDLGIHLVDLLLWVLDCPDVCDVSSRLYVQGSQLRDRSAQVEDYAAAQLTLANGTVAQLACSWRVHAGCDCVIEASFYGSEGGVSFRNVNGSFYDFQTTAFSGTSQRVLAAPPDNWGGRSLQRWVSALSQQRGFRPKTERYVHVAQVLDRIYDAHPTGHRPHAAAQPATPPTAAITHG